MNVNVFTSLCNLLSIYNLNITILLVHFRRRSKALHIT